MAANLSSTEVCELAGISYRQLDYWTRIGTVTPTTGHAQGSGSARRWTAHQAAVLAVLAEVGGLVAVSKLTDLVALLTDWPAESWVGRTVLVDRAGAVWLPDDVGHPSVAVAVDLGDVLARVRRKLGALT